MKTTVSDISRRYAAALKRHLKQSPGSNARAAHDLGLLAVAIGVETLDLARIHETAIVELLGKAHSVAGRAEMISRAEQFFAEAITPIEKTHRAAVEADGRVSRLHQTLRTRTAQSGAAARGVKRCVAQRQAAERALARSRTRLTGLLDESRRLEQRLRHLTHKILATQEENRQTISSQLRDEIAQALVAINLRILAMGKCGWSATETLKEEIATTQRLMRQSLETIHRFGQKIGQPQ